MKCLNKKLSPTGFVKYVKELKGVWRVVDKLVFHHTSSPLEKWQGSASIMHYYNLYRSRGWKTGPHIFIAPDGIWLFTPIKKQGTHAGKEGNVGSIGIEIAGRYFDGPPDDETICKYTALVTDRLLQKFDLVPTDIRNHTHFDNDNFCSPHLTQEWIFDNKIKWIGYVRNVISQYESAAFSKTNR